MCCSGSWLSTAAIAFIFLRTRAEYTLYMLRCTSVMPSRGRPLFFRTSELASSSRAAATMAKGPLLPIAVRKTSKRALFFKQGNSSSKVARYKK